MPDALRYGDLTLSDTRTLAGPRGIVRLRNQPYLLAERLLRRPGTIVPHGALIEAMYADRDEPDWSHDLLRKQIQHLRAAMQVVSEAGLTVMAERDVGYFVASRYQPKAV